jgi:peroxiredoxin
VIVVGIDPGAFKGGDDAARVASFAKQTGVTFPVGLDVNNSYGAFTSAKGISPFPLDVIIDRDGRVAYVGTEYVPDKMTAVIDGLLSK